MFVKSKHKFRSKSRKVWVFDSAGLGRGGCVSGVRVCGSNVLARAQPLPVLQVIFFLVFQCPNKENLIGWRKGVSFRLLPSVLKLKVNNVVFLPEGKVTQECEGAPFFSAVQCEPPPANTKFVCKTGTKLFDNVFEACPTILVLGPFSQSKPLDPQSTWSFSCLPAACSPPGTSCRSWAHAMKESCLGTREQVSLHTWMRHVAVVCGGCSRTTSIDRSTSSASWR